MFGQSLLSAFGIACTTDTDQLFVTNQSTTSAVTYELNGNPNSIGGSFNGTEGSSLSYTTGKFGQAASFNATSNSYINWGTGNTAGINNNNITFSFWIKPHSTPNGSGNDFQRALITTQNTYYMYIAQSDTNKIKFSNDQQVSGDPVNGYVTESNSSVSLNVWTHVAVSMSSTDGTKIYINGVLDKTQSNRKNNASSMSGESFIGGYRSNSGSSPYEYFYDGEIDQIRTFNSVLPQAAITALYNETTTTAQSASVDYQAANPNSIAYYKMADTTDQIGGNTLTNSNVNFNTEGKFGFAGKFNGSNSKLTISNSSFLPQGNNSRSISCWIKTTGGSNDGVIGYGNAANSQAFFIYINNQNKLGIYCYYDNTDGTIAISNNTWNHVVATYDGTNCKLYVNGVLDFTTAKTLNTGTGEFRIGGVNWNNGAEFFPGDIDQIRLYDSALSAANVSTLYKEVECEPAAINALANFNTVLYPGNASTNQISTVGFAPGFTWIKARNTNTSPEAHDVVRGEPSRLWVDNAYAASTAYNGFVKLTSNGFDLNNVGSGGNVNRAYNYVAWNWKAALANLSTSFNGSSSKIDITGQLPTSTTYDYGISCWVNANALGSSGRVIFSNFGAGGSFGTGQAGIYIWNSKLRFYIYSGSGSSFHVYDGSSTISTGTWYNIVSNIDINAGTSTSLTAYINGSPETLTFLASTNISGNSLTQLGVAQNTHFWDGKMGQVRIFNDVLTASEVSDLYAEPAASNNTLNYPAGAGCIAAYPLQTDAVDLSGNYSGASSNVTFGQPGYLTGNTDGTIPSTVAANPEAGFSIVKYKSTGTSGSTVGHGLTSPEMVMIKCTSTGSTNWIVYADPLGNSNYLTLNNNTSQATYSNWFYSNATTFTLNQTFGNANTSGRDYVAYCFTSIPGYSKIGSYTSTYPNTTSVYVGFQPSWVMIKSYNQARNWVIHDSARGADEQLYANLSNAEGNTGTQLQFTSTGFDVSGGSNDLDGGSSYSYIFLAIA